MRDGDVISIDLVRRTVDLELAPAEIAARQAACHCPPPNDFVRISPQLPRLTLYYY